MILLLLGLSLNVLTIRRRRLMWPITRVVDIRPQLMLMAG